MASLRRHPKSQYWIACLTLPNGKRTNRSTKTTNRKEAQRIADGWEEATRQRKTEIQIREVINQLSGDAFGVSAPSITLRDYTAVWLKRKVKETSDTTYLKYRNTASEFLKVIGDKADLEIQYIQPADVSHWRDTISESISRRTVNVKLKVLRSLFQAAWKDGYTQDNPAKKVDTLKEDTANRRPFTFEEVKRLLEVANVEWRGLIIFGLYSGQRLGDIARLTWANIDLANKKLHFVTRKTSRSQILPLAPAMLDYMAELEASDKPNSPLFPKAHKIAVKPNSTGRLSKQFYELMVSVGLAEPRKYVVNGKGNAHSRTQNELSFHCLRHTATTLLKQAGIPEAVARELIGHESASVSRQYTHVGDDALSEAVNKLPNLLI